MEAIGNEKSAKNEEEAAEGGRRSLRKTLAASFLLRSHGKKEGEGGAY